MEMSEVVSNPTEAVIQHAEVESSADTGGTIDTCVAGKDVEELGVNLSVGRPRRVCTKPKWMRTGDYVVDS